MNQNEHNIDEHLLLQYLLRNSDEELRTRVETWLKADSRNRELLSRLESVWLETGKLSPAPVAVDIEAAWLKMSARIDRHETIDRTKNGREKESHRRLYRYLLGAAAIILVLIGIFSLYRLITKPEKQIQLVSGGVVLHDTLPDGTKVTLNRNSKLIFSEEYKSGKRYVQLTGEAFFEVVRDEAHPFTVHAGFAGIRVLGTSFRVNMNPIRVVEVNVVEGRVMLFTVDEQRRDTASLILMAGEGGILSEDAPEPIKTETSSADELFWANRSLDFRNVTLADVFAMLKKHYPIEITVSDPSILNCRLTTSFTDEPAGKILTVIAESFGLKLESGEQKFHLTGNGCSKENQ